MMLILLVMVMIMMMMLFLLSLWIGSLLGTRERRRQVRSVVISLVTEALHSTASNAAAAAAAVSFARIVWRGICSSCFVGQGNCGILVMVVVLEWAKEWRGTINGRSRRTVVVTAVRSGAALASRRLERSLLVTIFLVCIGTSKHLLMRRMVRLLFACNTAVTVWYIGCWWSFRCDNRGTRLLVRRRVFAIAAVVRIAAVLMVPVLLLMVVVVDIVRRRSSSVMMMIRIVVRMVMRGIILQLQCSAVTVRIVAGGPRCRHYFGGCIPRRGSLNGQVAVAGGGAAARRVQFALLGTKLRDLLLVHGPFALLLFHVRCLLLFGGVPPHLTQQSRNVRVAHGRVLPLDQRPALLRVL